MAGADTSLYSDEAEESVLGAIFLHPATFHTVAAILEPDDFYHPARKAIFEAMLLLSAESQPIDSLTVAKRMRSLETLVRLNHLGGDEYFIDLANRVIAIETAHVETHAAIIAQKAERRRRMKLAVAIATGARGDSDDAEFLEESDSLLLQLAMNPRRGKSGPVGMKQALKEYTKDLERRYNQRASGQNLVGYTTGLEKLDELTAGIQPGQYVLVAARPSMGKSALAGGIARAAAASDRRVHCLFFSLEVPRTSNIGRLVAADAPIDGNRLRKADLQPVHWQRVSESMSRLSVLPIWWEDAAPLTAAQIRSTSYRWRMTEAKDAEAMIVIDYGGLIKLSRQKGDTETQAIADMSQSIKTLGKELRLPVVMLWQLNRDVEQRDDKRPKLSDLRSSGSLEQDGDLIVFIYRDEVYNPDDASNKGKAELIIGKQRDGATGVVEVAFRGENAAFGNLAVRDDGPPPPPHWSDE